MLQSNYSLPDKAAGITNGRFNDKRKRIKMTMLSLLTSSLHHVTSVNMDGFCRVHSRACCVSVVCYDILLLLTLAEWKAVFFLGEEKPCMIRGWCFARRMSCLDQFLVPMGSNWIGHVLLEPQKSKSEIFDFFFFLVLDSQATLSWNLCQLWSYNLYLNYQNI
jgi:hypothetical protein